jgi:hypothetical protein
MSTHCLLSTYPVSQFILAVDFSTVIILFIYQLEVTL